MPSGSSALAAMKRTEGKGARRQVALVTQRELLPDGALPGRVAELVDAGINLVQVREKDLGGKALSRLVVEVVAAAGRRCPVVVNGRLDVALAAGAHGVHLPERGLPLAAARRLAAPPFLLGVSAHTPEQVTRAREEGADYVFLGPAFPTASHPGATGIGTTGIQAGLNAANGLPLWAIGGIHAGSVPALNGLALTGVAAIRGLLLAEDPGAAVAALAGAPTSQAGQG